MEDLLAGWLGERGLCKLWISIEPFQEHAMRLPCVKFTLRSLMVAVGIVAVVLATERPLFHYAVDLVRSDDVYLWHELGVWVILHLALALIIGMIAAIVRAVSKDYAEAHHATGDPWSAGQARDGAGT